MKWLLLILFSLVKDIPVSQPKIFATNTGIIRFRSEAPMELINTVSNELKGAVDVEKKTFAFRIRINSFEGFNSPLQKEHFNENYMETEKYPEALFNGKIIEDIDLSQPGIHNVRAKGLLTIHGVPRERIIKGDVEVKNGIIKIKTAFTILLNDHNIPIPRVVKEKLANEIRIDLMADLVQK
jgi:hypothetical protein